MIGNLKEVDVRPGVHRIKNSALVINAEFDCANDEAVRPFVDGINGAKWHKFGGCSHLPHVEKPDEYIDLVADFLKN